MAKRVVSINIDEETLKDIDDMAKKMGINRSAFCEMTLKTAVGNGSLAGFYKQMWKGIMARGEEETSGFVFDQ